jgi:two-component system, sensor histidine kinase and response regulator
MERPLGSVGSHAGNGTAAHAQSAAALFRRSQQLRAVALGGALAFGAASVLVHVLAMPALVLLPLALGYAGAVVVFAREFRRNAFREVDDLDGARRAAQAEASAKALFLANMSHEIRTPMNGILGMSELLVRTRLDAEQQQMATTIQSSSEALLSVLNDILDFSKIEAGKLELETVDFDAWQVLDDCAGLLHHTADQKGVELMTYVDPRLWRCHRGDAARLRQVLLNFLGNAVKFTLEGEVVLGVDLREEDEASQHVRFWVRDSGVGIDPAALGRLFEPFSQADASTTRRFGGTGLGLVICRRLVELMGGRVDVQSQLGKGSTFAFDLTLSKGKVANARARAEDVDLSAYSLLIVDDNETNRQLMVMQLAPTRIGIDVASNAISAIEILRNAARGKRPFSMAILDMAMPGIDGIQLATAIKNDTEIPPTMVALASSLGTRPPLTEMAAAEVFRWLGKPLASGRLLQVVQDMACLQPRPENGAQPALPAAILAGPLPWPLPTTKAQTPPPASAEAVRRRERRDDAPAEIDVLVAEDNEINRRVLVGMLRRCGAVATFAVDGREALALVQQRPFAAVLMDCQMPEMDGYEATRRIRALGGTFATLPIVALTANVLPADRDACLAAGMNDFLAKPVKLDVLRAALLRWCPRQNPAELLAHRS